MRYFSESSHVGKRIQYTNEYRDKCVDIRKKALPVIENVIKNFNTGYNNIDYTFSLYQSINFDISKLDIEEVKIEVKDSLYKISTSEDDQSKDAMQGYYIFYYHDAGVEFVTIAEYYTKSAPHFVSEFDLDIFVTKEWVFTLNDILERNKFTAWLEQYSFISYVKNHVTREQVILDYINQLSSFDVNITERKYVIDYFGEESLKFTLVNVGPFYGFIYYSQLYRLGGTNIGNLRFTEKNEWEYCHTYFDEMMAEGEAKAQELIKKYKNT